jgi:hypothetical protein
MFQNVLDGTTVEGRRRTAAARPSGGVIREATTRDGILRPPWDESFDISRFEWASSPIVAQQTNILHENEIKWNTGTIFSLTQQSQEG